MGLFSNFKYVFHSSRLTSLLRIVRVARVFNMADAARTMTLDMLKAFDKIPYVNLRHKLNFRSCFFLISSDWKCHVVAGVPQGVVLGSIFSCYILRFATSYFP